MKRTLGVAACLAIVLTGPAFAGEGAGYKPPVMRDDGSGVSIWFGHIIRTGQWCAFDKQSVRRGYARGGLATGESGWARYGAQGLVSVTFEPDATGRLRLTPVSQKVVERMKAANYDPYFVNWDHFSRLSQLPFAQLLDLKSAPRPGAC